MFAFIHVFNSCENCHHCEGNASSAGCYWKVVTKHWEQIEKWEFICVPNLLDNEIQAKKISLLKLFMCSQVFRFEK